MFITVPSLFCRINILHRYACLVLPVVSPKIPSIEIRNRGNSMDPRTCAVKPRASGPVSKSLSAPGKRNPCGIRQSRCAVDHQNEASRLFGTRGPRRNTVEAPRPLNGLRRKWIGLPVVPPRTPWEFFVSCRGVEKSIDYLRLNSPGPGRVLWSPVKGCTSAIEGSRPIFASFRARGRCPRESWGTRGT